jgi:hypothetical protein
MKIGNRSSARCLWPRAATVALFALAACEKVEPVPYAPLALEEELRIRNPSEAGSRTQIVGASVDRDGSVYLMDATLQQLLVFDSTGRYLHSIGRAGNQPGEFSMLGSLGILGDTVWLADPRLGRITMFSRAGGLLGMVENDEDLNLPGISRYSLLGLLPGGAKLIGITPDQIDVDMRTARSVPFIRVAADGSADTLFHLPIAGNFAVGRGPNPRRVTQPFDERPALGVRWDGGAWVEVERAAGNDGPAAATVTRFTLEGGRGWSREVPLTATRIPGAVRDSIVDDATLIPEQARELRAWLQIPRRLPLVEAAMLSDDETIWLSEASLTDSTRWIRLDSLGNARGALRLPRDWQILHAGYSRLWILQSAPTRVPEIVRYRIK